MNGQINLAVAMNMPRGLIGAECSNLKEITALRTCTMVWQLRMMELIDCRAA